MSNLKDTLTGFAGFVATEIAAAGVLKGDGRPDQKPDMNSKPKGTLYKDNQLTDGAALWLKTGNGNSWKVISGDTGWLTLKKTASLLGTSHIKIRRIGDTVYYSFGGGQWGWFGIVKRGGPGYAPQTSYGNKGCRVIHPGGIPEGFQSVGSQVGNIYKDATAVYGTIYLGGIADSNFIALGFTNDIPTNQDTTDIRVSALNYPTDQAWPKLAELKTKGFIS